MKKYTALFAALTLVLALAGCGAETQTPMPGQSEQEEFTQNSTENVNETDGMTLLDSVFDTLSEGTDVTITLEQEGVRQSYPNTLDTYWAMRMPTSENFNWCGITKEDYSAASSEGHDMQLNPRDVTEITHEPRMDTAEVKRVELHLHTRMSNMDALTDTGSVVKLAAKWGMPAIAITDHGVAQSFPDAWHAGEGKIKILYGCEGYFVNNIDDRIAIHGHQDIGFSDEIICFDIETTGLKVRLASLSWSFSSASRRSGYLLPSSV